MRKKGKERKKRKKAGWWWEVEEEGGFSSEVRFGVCSGKRQAKDGLALYNGMLDRGRNTGLRKVIRRPSGRDGDYTHAV